MSAANVFVTRALPGPALAQLAEHTRMECWAGAAPISPAQLREKLADCDGLLCILTDRIDAALLQAAPKLKVVSSCSVGVDHVDLAALNQRRIPLGYTPGVLVDAMLPYLFGALTAISAGKGAAKMIEELRRHFCEVKNAQDRTLEAIPLASQGQEFVRYDDGGRTATGAG